ncbi:prephenate dehydrogenase/arogenate dehydrogenase family protein [Micromonospora sp. KC723]|uniref:prephenate dehydrogenase/arogenate dehydrogenase family protein n=1 Tax=Micromonospora sp. KC723 TaxID=2530381 RepID=UPI00210FEDF6|nr:prephenate dehydrogenase/arogenate dehydrogenase family protein [Micromonospora sp. KC723]
MGSMMAESLWRDGADVTVVDLVAEPVGRREAGRSRWTHLVADIAAPSTALTEVVGAADLVVLALPEPVVCAVLPKVSAAMPADALLADTSSVKSRVTAVAPAGRQFVSLNPMFSPALGMSGRPVVAVVPQGGARADSLVGVLADWGARVVAMTAAEHDRVVAASQALTHAAVLAFGLALQSLQVPVGTLSATAPPPHRTMLALLARLLSNSPEVYWDVQAANPCAPSARAALAAGLRDLARLVDEEDAEGFGRAFTGIRELFGPDLDLHQQRCAEMFAGFVEPTTGHPAAAVSHLPPSVTVGGDPARH